MKVCGNPWLAAALRAMAASYRCGKQNCMLFPSKCLLCCWKDVLLVRCGCRTVSQDQGRSSHPTDPFPEALKSEIVFGKTDRLKVCNGRQRRHVDPSTPVSGGTVLHNPATRLCVGSQNSGTSSWDDAAWDSEAATKIWKAPAGCNVTLLSLLVNWSVLPDFRTLAKSQRQRDYIVTEIHKKRSSSL